MLSKETELLDELNLVEQSISDLYNKVNKDDSKKLLEAIFHIVSLVRSIEEGTATKTYYKQKLNYAIKKINKILSKPQ